MRWIADREPKDLPLGDSQIQNITWNWNGSTDLDNSKSILLLFQKKLHSQYENTPDSWVYIQKYTKTWVIVVPKYWFHRKFKNFVIVWREWDVSIADRERFFSWGLQNPKNYVKSEWLDRFGQFKKHFVAYQKKITFMSN